MRLVSRLLGLLLGIGVVLIVPIAIWITASGVVLSDADAYLKALAGQNLYDELIPNLLPALVQESSQSPQPDPETLTLINIVRHMDTADWAAVAAELTPTDWLQHEVEHNVTTFFDWLHDRAPYPDLRIDTGALRERLTGPAGQRAVNLILASWPPCTEEELARFLNTDTQNAADYPLCQPPGEYLALTSEALTGLLQEAALSLPDRIPEPDWLANARIRDRLNEIKALFLFVQAIIVELWLIPLALMAMIVAIVIRSWRAFTRWHGTLLVIAGLLALLPLPLLLSPALMARNDIGMAFSNGAPRYIDLVARNVVAVLIAQLSLPVIMLAGVVLGGGFILLVISVFIGQPDEEPVTGESAENSSTLPASTTAELGQSPSQPTDPFT
ncbi:MAG: hypothetical protein Kow0077_07570 [Anaerolineae bacterium]